MTNQERDLLIALQGGAPEVIGYGPERQDAFRHGWNEAMGRVYSVLLASSPTLAGELIAIDSAQAADQLFGVRA